MSKIRRDDRGFSLVELLTVLAIMAVLTGLSFSTIPGILSTYNRKTAVDLVMATVEQARVAAIQSGENTYVVMALAKDSGVSPDALIVVGDPSIGSTATREIFYTHWVKLPLNVRFRSSASTLPKNGVASFLPGGTALLPPLNGGVSNYTFAGFAFNSTGTLYNPASGFGLDVALYEGIRNKLGTETARGPSAKATQNLSDAGIYDVIRLSRYTGRSWADVSSLAQK